MSDSKVRGARWLGPVVIAMAISGGAISAGDPVAGAAEFKALCGLCHTLEADARSGTGPNLHGIVDAPAGRVDGFFYSAAHRDSGLVFTAEQLDTYLADPQATVPGTKKRIKGIADPVRRANIIAYLEEAAR